MPATLDDLAASVAALDAKLDRTLRGLALLVTHLGAAPRAQAPADDGADEEIGKDPPRWKGEPTAPIKMSEASPEYLDAVAEFKEFTADSPKPGKEKYAAKDRRTAARARGWAARKRREAPAVDAPEEL